MNKIQIYSDALDAIDEEIIQYKTKLRSNRREEFTKAGGCERCNGRPWGIVVWDTLDSMSGCYAEYGPCPERENNPEAHGKEAPFNHSYSDKYDNQQGSKNTLVQTEEEQQELSRLERAYSSIKGLLDGAIFRAVPRKGARVEVVKGRKVPKGTNGVVFWAGKSQWGERVGFKEDGSDEPIWIASTNVKVIE